jgi:hypothetical protein
MSVTSFNKYIQFMHCFAHNFHVGLTRQKLLKKILQHARHITQQNTDPFHGGYPFRGKDRAIVVEPRGADNRAKDTEAIQGRN